MSTKLIVRGYSVPHHLVRWLRDEVEKLNRRAYFHRKESFVLTALHTDKHSVAVELRYWLSDKPGYANAAEKLCKAAQRGEQIVVKLPRIPASKSQHVGQPGEKLSLDVEVYDVVQHNGFY